MVPGPLVLCRLLFIGAAAIASTFLLQAVVPAGPFVFSLDNRPRLPNSIDPFGFGNGAEDPFGLVPFPTLVGPSPSLHPHLSDADILVPGIASPQVNTNRPFGTNYIDAISSNLGLTDGHPLRLAFSVDRASSGVGPSAVNEQFLLNQQPGDIFLSDRDFPEPGQFVGVTSGFGWWGTLSSVGPGSTNILLLNQSRLTLTAGSGVGIFDEDDELAPPIAPGTHDNVDAFDIAPFDTTGDLVGDKRLYFSVNPDQPILNSEDYTSAADIYRMEAGSFAPLPFAHAGALGLDPPDPFTFEPRPNRDDVDALILFDLGFDGFLDPGTDYALFSLSPGSRTLLSTPGITAADVFFTDFRGSFATFASDADLGLSGTTNPAELDGGGGSGSGGTDNTDALGSYALGDMDWSGGLDIDDVDDFVQGLTRPDDYRDVNLDHFGQPASRLGDFSMPRDGLVDFDDIPPFRTAIAGPLGSGQGVPEPAAVCLAIIAIVALLSRQLRSTWSLNIID